MLCCLLGALAASLSGAAATVLGGAWKWLASGAACFLLAGAVIFLAAEHPGHYAAHAEPICSGAFTGTTDAERIGPIEGSNTK